MHIYIYTHHTLGTYDTIFLYNASMLVIVQMYKYIYIHLLCLSWRPYLQLENGDGFKRQSQANFLHENGRYIYEHQLFPCEKVWERVVWFMLLCCSCIPAYKGTVELPLLSQSHFVVGSYPSFGGYIPHILVTCWRTPSFSCNHILFNEKPPTGSIHHHTTPSAPLQERNQSVVDEDAPIPEPPDVVGIPLLLARWFLPMLDATSLHGEYLETSWVLFGCGVVDGFGFVVAAL